MLKHPDITRRRIAQFLYEGLKPFIYAERTPLKIEINETPASSQLEAEAGPWKEVEKGYKYGPAYTTVWFRLTGIVPQTSPVNRWSSSPKSGVSAPSGRITPLGEEWTTSTQILDF